ncbi:MAG: hypothetical protein LKI67_01780 [Olsenella sp.]|jgi:hypothetical protein|nr:hypothetical protein [Olsenella sp.]MCI1880412.1 hypothetical protein [Olsenella sp.]
MSLASLWTERFHRAGIGLLQPAAGCEVGAVHHHVGVRDPVGVIVVVDDCDFIVVEALLRPGNRQTAELAELDAVVGIWREDVVLPGTCALAVPRSVVAEVAARPVHLPPPVERLVVLQAVADPLHGYVDVHEISGEGTVVLLEVSLNISSARVSRYALDVRHR